MFEKSFKVRLSLYFKLQSMSLVTTTYTVQKLCRGNKWEEKKESGLKNRYENLTKIWKMSCKRCHLSGRSRTFCINCNLFSFFPAALSIITRASLNLFFFCLIHFKKEKTATAANPSFMFYFILTTSKWCLCRMQIEHLWLAHWVMKPWNASDVNFQSLFLHIPQVWHKKITQISFYIDSPLFLLGKIITCPIIIAQYKVRSMWEITEYLQQWVDV